MQDAFTALDVDWSTFVQSPHGARALRQWADDDDRYRQFSNVGALRESFEARDRVHEREALLADLVRRCPTEPAARLIVLAAIRPGLVRLANRIAPVLGWEEAASVMVAAALDRLSIPYSKPSERAAARLLGDIWHQVWLGRERARKEQAAWGHQDDLELAADTPADETVDANGEFLELVEHARRTERVSKTGARLVVMHRVLGYSNVEIARMEGLQPCTVRKRRREAEVEIAEIAVA